MKNYKEVDSRFRPPRLRYGETGGNDKDKEEIASSPEYGSSQWHAGTVAN